MEKEREHVTRRFLQIEGRGYLQLRAYAQYASRLLLTPFLFSSLCFADQHVDIDIYRRDQIDNPELERIERLNNSLSSVYGNYKIIDPDVVNIIEHPPYEDMSSDDEPVYIGEGDVYEDE